MSMSLSVVAGNRLRCLRCSNELRCPQISNGLHWRSGCGGLFRFRASTAPPGHQGTSLLARCLCRGIRGLTGIAPEGFPGLCSFVKFRALIFTGCKCHACAGSTLATLLGAQIHTRAVLSFWHHLPIGAHLKSWRKLYWVPGGYKLSVVPHGE